ncbi:LysR family transcriptional regulator [Roseateles sp. DAIF2]|uniref:LysR family transcriptional regulator n=1 Tax=Roseateles sp. DAIF2 TaxID=2714952 RepID=UPI0018A2641B|nr:LysR family transcriptional regulator [Roseateles sp. DAIF2]QPF71506.1 LysR family transcriptional regulator [Roseateles sp. DAIF2]
MSQGRRFEHLNDVEALLQVVDRGSISAAAVAFGTTPSVISRAIARLEARLGVQLLRRSTRRQSLTEAGRDYLEQARQAFALIAEAENAVQGSQQALSGRVRLSVPTTYGHYRLPRLLEGFVHRHPQVQVELSIANRNVDLVSEGFDLAIRLGQLPDSGLVARKLEDAPLRLVASPAYLARKGMPATLEQLQRDGHCCLAFVMPSTGRLAPWLLRDAQGAALDWLPPAALRVEDDVLGLVSLAEQGLGICQSYDFVVAERLRRGSLVELLPAASGRTRPFSLLYAPHRRLAAASRALIEHLGMAAEALHRAGGPGASGGTG